MNRQTILDARGEEMTRLSGEYFAWEDIDQSRSVTNRHAQHSVDEAKEKYLKKAVACPTCKRPANELSWVYLLTPEWTWQTLCGKAGWVTICDRCKLQVEFFQEVVS